MLNEKEVIFPAKENTRSYNIKTSPPLTENPRSSQDPPP